MGTHGNMGEPTASACKWIITDTTQTKKSGYQAVRIAAVRCAKKQGNTTAVSVAEGNRRSGMEIADRIISESVNGGTGCGKVARPGLWGSGEATNRSTRKL